MSGIFCDGGCAFFQKTLAKLSLHTYDKFTIMSKNLRFMSEE